jgi:hypothetical protein
LESGASAQRKIVLAGERGPEGPLFHGEKSDILDPTSAKRWSISYDILGADGEWAIHERDGWAGGGLAQQSQHNSQCLQGEQH